MDNYVPSEVLTEACRKRKADRATRLSRQGFRADMSAMAGDFAKFVQDRGAIDIPGGSKLDKQPVDALEVAVVDAVGCDHARVKDGGQGVQSPLKSRSLFTKLLNFRIFRSLHRDDPSLGRGVESCRADPAARQHLNSPN